jgi:3,4-dihydroxy 2-butanone 4-phosphate synthase/GTP cyclohydrolase II
MKSRADELGLNLMVSSNTALHETAFTVSIDLIGHWLLYRYQCIRQIHRYSLAHQRGSKRQRLRPSGTYLPAARQIGRGIAQDRRTRRLQWDLARLAGLYPMGVLVEILNADGTMARLPQLVEVAKEHDLKIISIDDLVAYRMKTERLVKRELETTISTVFGVFDLIAYTDVTCGDTHLVVKKGTWSPDEPVLVRVHSASETGDILGTLLEDYGSLISKSLLAIEKEGKGALVYPGAARQGRTDFKVVAPQTAQ